MTLYALPALIAGILKFLLLGWMIASKRNINGTLAIWVFFSACLGVNIVELSLIFSRASLLDQPIFGTLYFFFATYALASLLHYVIHRFYLTLNPLIYATYSYSILIIAALIDNRLITGFREWNFSYTRVTGDLYFLFEYFTLSCLLLTLLLLIHSAIYNNSGKLRLAARWLILGLCPLFLIVPTIIILQKAGIFWINTIVTLPLALTFFMAIVLYASKHQYLLYIPLPLSSENLKEKNTRDFLINERENFLTHRNVNLTARILSENGIHLFKHTRPDGKVNLKEHEDNNVIYSRRVRQLFNQLIQSINSVVDTQKQVGEYLESGLPIFSTHYNNSSGYTH